MNRFSISERLECRWPPICLKKAGMAFEPNSLSHIDAALLRCLYGIAGTGQSFIALARLARPIPSPEQAREVWQSVQASLAIARERAFDRQHHTVFEHLEHVSAELREYF